MYPASLGFSRDGIKIVKIWTLSCSHWFFSRFSSDACSALELSKKGNPALYLVVVLSPYLTVYRYMDLLVWVEGYRQRGFQVLRIRCYSDTAKDEVPVKFPSCFHIKSSIVNCNVHWIVRSWVNFSRFIANMLRLILYFEKILLSWSVLANYVVVVVIL